MAGSTPPSAEDEKKDFIESTILEHGRARTYIASLLRGAAWPLTVISNIAAIIFGLIISLSLQARRKSRPAGVANSLDDESFASLIILPIAALTATYGSAQGYYLLSQSHSRLTFANAASSAGVKFIAGSMFLAIEFSYLAVRGVLSSNPILATNPFSAGVDPEAGMRALKAAPPLMVTLLPKRAAALRQKILELDVHAADGGVFQSDRTNPPVLLRLNGMTAGIRSVPFLVEVGAAVISAPFVVHWLLHRSASCQAWTTLAGLTAFILTECVCLYLFTALMSNDVLRRYYRYIALQRERDEATKVSKSSPSMPGENSAPSGCMRWFASRMGCNRQVTPPDRP